MDRRNLRMRALRTLRLLRVAETCLQGGPQHPDLAFEAGETPHVPSEERRGAAAKCAAPNQGVVDPASPDAEVQRLNPAFPKPRQQRAGSSGRRRGWSEAVSRHPPATCAGDSCHSRTESRVQLGVRVALANVVNGPGNVIGRHDRDRCSRDRHDHRAAALEGNGEGFGFNQHSCRVQTKTDRGTGTKPRRLPNRLGDDDSSGGIYGRSHGIRRAIAYGIPFFLTFSPWLRIRSRRISIVSTRPFSTLPS